MAADDDDEMMEPDDELEVEEADDELDGPELDDEVLDDEIGEDDLEEGDDEFGALDAVQHLPLVPLQRFRSLGLAKRAQRCIERAGPCSRRGHGTADKHDAPPRRSDAQC